MTKLTGQPVRVTVRLKETDSINPNPATTTPSSNAPKRGDRQIAMEMKIVKQALEVFPDAALINVNTKHSKSQRK